MAKTPPDTDNGNLDKDVVLNYIDKVYLTQTRIWESMNRIVISELILSLVIIALSSGIISLDETIEVTGFKIKLSLTVLLSSGALIIAALFTVFFSQLQHSFKFEEKLDRLYASIGYEVSSVLDHDVQAFEHPGFYLSVLATTSRRKKYSGELVKWFYKSFGLVAALGVLIFIPLTAQVLAGLKVAALFGRPWWIYLTFAVLVVFTITFLVISIYESEYGN
jgi:hypothetical protein